MSKQVYTLKLTSEADSTNFLTQGAGANYECIETFPNMPRVFVFNLTEEEADVLQNLEDVEILCQEVEPELDSPRTYGSATYSESNRHVRCVSGTSAIATLGGSGADYISDNYFHQTGIFPVDSNGVPTAPDYFDAPDNLFQDTATNVTGMHVDVIIAEPAYGTSDVSTIITDDMLSQIDMQGITSTDIRVQRIDWSDFNSNINQTENNQITNNTDPFISGHMAGCASVAVGKYCGLAKSANVYFMNTSGNLTSQCFDAVLQFHRRKNDPTHANWRGRPTATIMNNSWGFSSLTYDRVTPVDSITQIETTTQKGVAHTVVATRPASGSWGSDLTPFVNAGIVPRLVTIDNVHTWVITISTNGRNTSGTYINLGNYFDYSNEEGLYVVKSAGNSSDQYAKLEDPKSETRVFLPQNSHWARQESSDLANWTEFNLQGQTQIVGNSAGEYWYPNKAYGKGSNEMIEVGAAQHRSTEGYRMPNTFSARGPGVDLFAGGSRTWSASYSNLVLSEGNRWGFFGGTSCAGPVAAGMAACFLEDYYNKYKKYPTQQKLLQIMKKHAKSAMQPGTVIQYDDTSNNNATTAFSWSNVPDPANLPANGIRAVGSFPEYRMLELSGDPNGGPDRYDLIETTNDRIFIPYGIRMGNGIQITEPRGRMENKRPTYGQTYPRRKLRIGS